MSSRGARLPMALAGVFVALSALMLLRVDGTTSVLFLLVTYGVFGVGNGLLNAPITNTAVAGMPRSQSGVASSTASTGRQVGSALGVAVFGTLMYTSLGDRPLSGLADASHSSWWVMFASGIALVVVALVVTTPRARRTSRQVAELMEIGD